MCVATSHSKSVVTVQRAFPAKYAKDPTTDKTIRACYKQFTETECLHKLKATMRGKNLNIVSMCEPCHPWCTHRTSIVVKSKNNFFSFRQAVNSSIRAGPLVFLLKNVCNHGEHYETPCSPIHHMRNNHIQRNNLISNSHKKFDRMITTLPSSRTDT